ncbi:MAG: hypothetical protein V3S24_15285 [Candidatus Tectomicrobia bacterium]
MDVARRQVDRDDLLGGLIDAQVRLPPRPAPDGSVLSDVPLAGSVHFQTRRIDHDMAGSLAWTDEHLHAQRRLPAADSAVVRCGQVERHELHDRLQVSLSGPKAEVKD